MEQSTNSLPDTDSIEIYRMIFDHMPGKVVIRDQDSRIIFANRAFAEPYGRAASEVVGELNASYWAEKGRPADQIASWIEEDRELIRTGRNKEYVQEIVRANGERAFFHNHKTVITLPDGEKYLLCQYADITERKLEELSQAEEETQSAELAGIRKTIVTYAHQINNPLTGILALTQLMIESDECPQEFFEMLGDLKTSAIRIRDVVLKLTSEKEIKTREYLNRHEMIDLENEGENEQ